MYSHNEGAVGVKLDLALGIYTAAKLLNCGWQREQTPPDRWQHLTQAAGDVSVIWTSSLSACAYMKSDSLKNLVRSSCCTKRDVTATHSRHVEENAPQAMLLQLLSTNISSHAKS